MIHIGEQFRTVWQVNTDAGWVMQERTHHTLKAAEEHHGSLLDAATSASISYVRNVGPIEHRELHATEWKDLT